MDVRKVETISNRMRLQPANFFDYVKNKHHSIRVSTIKLCLD